MFEPRPIGYIEVQRSWVGHKTAAELDLILADVRATVAADFRGMVDHGSRIETSKDGAGVQHYTLYMGFAPARAAAPPLNPRNLNDADHPTIGNPVGDFFIGQKEQKF